MSFAILYPQPQLLGRDTHRGKRLRRTANVGPAANLHACFLAAGEFAEAAKEYVIAFVDATVPGSDVKEVSPIVLLGLREKENLFVRQAAAIEGDPNASKWDAQYVPAFVRRYPFAYASGGPDQPAVIIDGACEGLNDTEGELLVQEDGEASPFLQQMIKFLDAFEVEVQGTRAMCQRIVELGLLKPVQIDVTLPDGKVLNAGGVQVVDEAKLKALPQAAAGEMLANGMLGLLYAHLISTTNVQRLTQRLGERLDAGAKALG